MKTRLRVFVFLSILLILITSAQALTLEGNLYNHKLSLIESVTVSISTNPVQEIYSENGIYRFQVEPGTYTITASSDKFGTTEEVGVIGNEKQYHDLVLFPNYAQQESLFDESFTLAKFASPALFLKELLLTFVLFFVLFFTLFLLRNRLRKNKKPDTKKETTKIKEITIGSGPKATKKVVEKKEEVSKKEEKTPSITVEAKNQELTAEMLDELIKEEEKEVKVEKSTKVQVNKTKEVLEDVQEKEVAKDVEVEVDEETFALESELFDAGELLEEAEKKKSTKVEEASTTPEIDEDSAKYVSQVLRILKANGGSVPQSKFMKELSHLPEETVLTILNGLEFQEQIERIKRGRGYVINLK